MTDDKNAKKHAGAPAANKPSEGERFDLFRTFRHPYKPGDPVPSSPPRQASKPPKR